MDNQNEKFYCPYCGCSKDKKFLHYRTETGNYHQTFEKNKGLRAAYDYKHINYKYQIYRLPICTDCKRIRRNASLKATLIVLIPFTIAFYYLYQTIGENENLWSIVVPLGMVSVILLTMQWGLTVLFIKMKGLNYSAHKEYEATMALGNYYEETQLYDFISEKIKNQEEMNEMQQKNEKLKEDFDKHHKIIEVDGGQGKKMFLSRYVSDAELEKERKDKGNVDFSKIKKFEEGASVDYSDEDFEGNFV